MTKITTTQIEDFFYSKASKRIGERIKKSGLKYSEIYQYDHKQISRIVTNKREKNNRFLICDAVISSYHEDEESGKKIPCGLLHVPKLNFNSEKEILWGTDEEISSYIFDLFTLLWEETTSSPCYKINGELYLCDYVPYAKYSSYWNILFSPANICPAIYHAIYEDTVIQEIDPARENAIVFLYNKCKSEFTSLFTSFTEEKKSFHMLRNTIKKDLLENLFVKMIKKYEPDSSSLGLRVRDLIQADLTHCASQVVGVENSPYYKSLINASSTYILALEKIQEQQIERNGAD